MGIRSPPPWSDWVGYEVLLEEIERHRLDRVDGDVFDPAFDASTTLEGWRVSDLYAAALSGRNRRELFDQVTGGCTNLVVVSGDSTSVEIPTERLAFAFVDGSHVADDVRTDFERAGERLTPGGIADIARVWTRDPALLFVQRGT
jgi:hypothetical protein